MSHLVNWSLNTTDAILSAMSPGSGELMECLEGTFAAGFVADEGGKWRVMCMAPLDVKEFKHKFVLRASAIGIWLILVVMVLVYGEIRRICEAIVGQRPGRLEALARAVGVQTATLKHVVDGLDAIRLLIAENFTEKLVALNCRLAESGTSNQKEMDNIAVQVAALECEIKKLGRQCGLKE